MTPCYRLLPEMGEQTYPIRGDPIPDVILVGFHFPSLFRSSVISRRPRPIILF